MSTPGRPVTLGVFPYYPNNPWQELVYSALRAEGATIIPLESLDDLSWADDAERRGDAIALHVNWTAPLSQVGTIAESFDRVERASAVLDALAAREIATLWTVHNVLPHDAHHLLPEVALCRALAEKADVITILNPGTPAAVRPWYSLPSEKVAELPPPSYLGTYPDDVSRAEARARFAIDSVDPVLLLLGTLRPYKGIEEAVSAMPEVRQHLPGARLLIAGELGPGYDGATLEAIVADAPGVDLHVGYVPEEDVQWWMRAADAMILPYRASLNSGVLLLAAGFGLPVIMTDGETALGLGGAEWVHVIPAGRELASGIVDGIRVLGAREAAAAAVEAARAHDPARISRLFADDVRAAIATRRGAATT